MTTDNVQTALLLGGPRQLHDVVGSGGEPLGDRAGRKWAIVGELGDLLTEVIRAGTEATSSRRACASSHSSSAAVRPASVGGWWSDAFQPDADGEGGVEGGGVSAPGGGEGAVVARLARGEATVGELGEPFDLTHQAISRHVGILRRCGLIHQRVDGQRRPCRLNVERMQELSDWIAEQQREWESRLARLEEHLALVQDERDR